MLYTVVANCLRPVFRWARMRVEGRDLVRNEGPVPPVPAGRRPRARLAEAG